MIIYLCPVKVGLCFSHRYLDVDQKYSQDILFFLFVTDGYLHNYMIAKYNQKAPILPMI